MEGAEAVQEAEEAGAARKRRRVGEEDSADLLVLGDDGEDGRYEGIAEEAVAEVMRWLEAEIAPSPPAGASVTVNGNEESCGPSFSAAASTVMAAVDTRAGAPPPPPAPWPWPEPAPQPVPVLPAPPGADADMSGAGEAADEEWLARLLTCGALLEGVL